MRRRDIYEHGTSDLQVSRLPRVQGGNPCFPKARDLSFLQAKVMVAKMHVFGMQATGGGNILNIVENFLKSSHKIIGLFSKFEGVETLFTQVFECSSCSSNQNIPPCIYKISDLGEFNDGDFTAEIIRTFDLELTCPTGCKDPCFKTKEMHFQFLTERNVRGVILP